MCETGTKTHAATVFERSPPSWSRQADCQQAHFSSWAPSQPRRKHNDARQSEPVFPDRLFPKELSRGRATARCGVDGVAPTMACRRRWRRRRERERERREGNTTGGGGAHVFRDYHQLQRAHRLHPIFLWLESQPKAGRPSTLFKS